jgi:hypothetical protein
MQRLLKALPIALVAAAMVPTGASAKTIVVGQTKTKLVAPSCPSSVAPANCTIVLYWATALPSISNGVKYATTVTTPGRITSYNLGISNLSSNASTRKTYITELDTKYGGNPRSILTVLRPVGNKGLLSYRVIERSAVANLQGWLGKVKKFPLKTAMPVIPGDLIALTVPTWAPVLPLATDPSQNAYLQARSTNCPANELKSNADVQSFVGEFAKYACSYGTRPQFTANETTS